MKYAFTGVMTVLALFMFLGMLGYNEMFVTVGVPLILLSIGILLDLLFLLNQPRNIAVR